MGVAYVLYDREGKRFLELGKNIRAKKGFQRSAETIAAFLSTVCDSGGTVEILPDCGNLPTDTEEGWQEFAAEEWPGSLSDPEDTHGVWPAAVGTDAVQTDPAKRPTREE